MKRRNFLIALGVVPPLVLSACKGDEPNLPTIFTGFLIDEKDKPVEGVGFQFSGNTGGFSPRSLFDLNTRTDAKGYYYLEQVIPKGTGGINFQPTGSVNYPTSLNYNEYRCLVNGIYQKDIPIVTGQKNELNFKIFKI
jgi:hypothetical protein